MADAIKTSSGVEKLIERLRQEGIKAGEDGAKNIVFEAEKKAAEILAAARLEAEGLIQNARKEIEREQKATLEALKIALRDSILQLKEGFTGRFKAQVKQIVEKELSDRDFLRKMILAITHKAAPPENEQIEILISREKFEAENSAQDEGMDFFIQSITKEILRKGLEFKPSAVNEAGIQIRLIGTDIEIDLGERALSDLILSHLIPRFREAFEGIRR